MIKLRHVVLAALLVYVLVSIHLNSDAHFNAVAAPGIRTYLEQARTLRDYRAKEGYIRNTNVEIKDQSPSSSLNRKYRAISVIVHVKLNDGFEKLKPVEQCRRLYVYNKDLTEAERSFRESTGYGQAVENGKHGRGDYISDCFAVYFRGPDHDFSFYDDGSMAVTVPGAYGKGAKSYTFRVQDGEITDFAEKKSYSRYGGKGTSTAENGGASSRRSSGSGASGTGSSSSSGKRRAAWSDPYDVNDYDYPDDFAEEWAEEFADFVDGDFDDGYDEAYDYWEENQ